MIHLKFIRNPLNTDAPFVWKVCIYVSTHKTSINYSQEMKY